MKRLIKPFDVEETCVEATEPLHTPRLGACAPNKANCAAFQEVSQVPICMPDEQNR